MQQIVSGQSRFKISKRKQDLESQVQVAEMAFPQYWGRFTFNPSQNLRWLESHVLGCHYCLNQKQSILQQRLSLTLESLVV